MKMTVAVTSEVKECAPFVMSVLLSGHLQLTDGWCADCDDSETGDYSLTSGSRMPFFYFNYASYPSLPLKNISVFH